jgi:hypothetical protein
MLRRLVYVNFFNLYVHRERFDPTNARHRLELDFELKQRMMEKGSLERLPSYLVRGAVDSYMRRSGGPLPPGRRTAPRRSALCTVSVLPIVAP